MRLVLATHSLGLGGSQSYLLTVAEQLDRLGHEVAVYVHERGAGGERARKRAISVVDRTGLPADCDAVLVQDPGMSHELASCYPGVPQVFVAHGEGFDFGTPPQLDDAVSLVVALNDRVARRLGAFAVEAEIVRLRQPIDIAHFTIQAPLPDVPRRALLLSNNPADDRMAMLETACGHVGLQLVRLGRDVGQTDDPRPILADAEIVIGYGRSTLEAMACGRAAYVYDWYGGDGWVTAETYPDLEADGFGGRGDRVVVDAARLREDLGGYAASMGAVNRDLVVANHRANVHAQQLIELLRGLEPKRSARAPLEEMARLVRLEWRARMDAHVSERENGRLRIALREAKEAKARAFEEARRHYESTLSWRLTKPLRAIRRMTRRHRAEPTTGEEKASEQAHRPGGWPQLTLLAEQLEADVVPRNWMSPVPTPSNRDVWSEPRALGGVNLDVDGALSRAESDLAQHAGRLADAIAEAGLEQRFRLWNEAYQAADAELLYAMMRACRPRRVLELGSGYSTMVLGAALKQNSGEGAEAHLTSVDPDPVAVDPDPVAGIGDVTLVRRSATEIPIEEFLELNAGDFLFVDTTHTVKLGSEVNYLVLDVLPRLRTGVIVHFHDIFLPYEYPREWFERRMYFAEQYLLEAFLAGNDSYEVIFPAHAAARADRARLARLLPSLADPRADEWVGPAAFWIRRCR